MANHVELKSIAKARLETVKILTTAKDWQGAAYVMAITLEVALKAVVCKTLRLEVYPESVQDDDKYFMTHKFDRLLRISGLEDFFGARGAGFQVWSEFTKEYPGDWPSMRYDVNRLRNFDEVKTGHLYDCLAGNEPGSEGILTLLTKELKW